MTVQELHYAIDQGLQKVGSFVYDNFLEEEVDHFLNVIQNRFIKSSVFNKGGLSTNQRQLDDIRNVLVLDEEDVFNVNPTLKFQTTLLPADYMFLVNLRVELVSIQGVDSLVQDSKWVPTRMVDIDELYKLQENPFNKASHRSPIACMTTDEVRILQDSKRYILKGSRMDYIRQPNKISLPLNQSCELAEHTHQEIVDQAVQYILELIESPRFQTKAAENRLND
jgi:hypothetical protein